MAPRTPEENKKVREQTRQQILDAAFELFADEGFSRTSIASVANKAEVSKGLIYHYFKSKASILDAIFDQLVRVGDQLLDFPEDFSAADKMGQTIHGTFQFIEEHTGKGRLMIGLALQPDIFSRLKPKIDEVNKTQLTLYIDILKELGYDQPELEAYKLGAIMDGIFLAYITMGDEYPLHEMKQKILDEYVPNQ